jgi:hypothetical protein
MGDEEKSGFEGFETAVGVVEVNTAVLRTTTYVPRDLINKCNSLAELDIRCQGGHDGR